MNTEQRPRIAIISNSQTPYRMHVHGRVVRELKEIELFSVFTHEFSNSPWRLHPSPGLQPLYMGQGEKSEKQSHWSNQRNEWAKGGAVLKWLVQNAVRFVLLEGYNDFGRLRILHGCRRLRIPCFVFGDSNILADRPAPWKAAIKRRFVGWVVRCATGIFYCGKLGRQYFQRYGAEEKRLFPFPYEPDYFTFENVPEARLETVRQAYAIQPGRRYLIFSGRFVPVKRVDLLLQAFVEVAAQRPEWDLILIGDGPLREPLLEKLPTALRARVISTGFISDAATVAALYQFGSVLVLPSDFEPWGVVVTEAAMSSLALICSSVTGAGVELIQDGINGHLFPAGDAAALRDVMLDATLPGKTERMRTASREILNKWRQTSDPVKGLRAALRFAGILP